MLKSTLVSCSLIAFVTLACNHENDRPANGSYGVAGTSSSALPDPYGKGDGPGTTSDGAPLSGSDTTDSSGGTNGTAGSGAH